MSERMTISAEAIGTVSAILQVPSRARACFVLAHGAGAGMTHPSLEGLAADLHDRGIASLRFQFPFMERGTKCAILRPLRGRPSGRRLRPPRSACRSLS